VTYILTCELRTGLRFLRLALYREEARMSSQIRGIEIKQRRTRKKKIVKLRNAYKKASSEEKHRIEEKLRRVAYATPTSILLAGAQTK
jgi:hypothetical protein